VNVCIHRCKACASRCIQTLYVNGFFFGWNLVGYLREYMSHIPDNGPLWRSIPPNPKDVCEARALAHSTVDSIPTKMAHKLQLTDPQQYHSHSLRRTGATLLALSGRTNEEIRAMGNWTGLQAVNRYIESSIVASRKQHVDVTGFTKPTVRCEVAPTGNPTIVQQKSTAEDTILRQDPVSTDESEQYSPPKKKVMNSGIVFSGAINQVIVVSSLDSVKSLINL